MYINRHTCTHAHIHTHSAWYKKLFLLCMSHSQKSLKYTDQWRLPKLVNMEFPPKKANMAFPIHVNKGVVLNVGQSCALESKSR
jgi:hypothetical protein